MKLLNPVFAASITLVFILTAQSTLAEEVSQSGRFETSDGVTLHYLESGSGPPLVLVPGWTMPAEIWHFQIQHFASTHRVVALDPRGQGRSDTPAHGYQPSRRALDIKELLVHLGGTPAIVAGWSLAMQEVLVMTHEYGTEHVRAVVLVDHLIDFEASGLASRFINLQTNREVWTRNFIRAIHNTPQSEEYLETMTQAALSTPTNAAAIMIANLILMGPTDLRPALNALDRPALVINSSQDWAVEQAEMVRKGWPEIQVVVIDDTSHALFVDKPDEFNHALEQFIESLPE